MKVIILAGGLGTRLAEETETRPKPMVEIGGKAIHALYRLIPVCQGAHYRVWHQRYAFISSHASQPN